MISASQIARKKESLSQFLFIEVLIYLYFLSLDLFFPTSTSFSSFLKFVGIILCTAISRYSNARLLQMTLCLTLCADFLLLFTNRYETGILLFCLIQGCYYKMRFPGQRIVYFYLIPSVLTIPTAFLLWAAGFQIDFIVMIAAFYLLSLLYNAALSIRHLKRADRAEKWFLAGLLLLLLCDLQVGLYNAAPYMSAKLHAALPLTVLTALSGCGMWLFYLPSQVLITLSQIQAACKA